MTYVTPSRTPGRQRRPFAEVVGRAFDPETCPFLIPDLGKDTPRGTYITVARARYYKGPGQSHVRQWYQTVVEFFGTVKEFVDRGDQVALGRARSMLAVRETAETRLGYSQHGSKGTAVGDGELREELLVWCRSNSELLNACLTEPDTVSLAPLFGLDRVSDLMVGIGKKSVIAFTKEMAQLYGFDENCMRDAPVENVWQPDSQTFRTEIHRLPVDDDGNVILLVPSDLIRSAPPITAAQYFGDFYGPEFRGNTSKAAVLSDASAHPGRLKRFAEDRMRDPDKYLPRRDLRPRKKRKHK